MLATFVVAAVAAVAAAGPVRVTVEVVEYISQKPLVGAKVTLIEDAPDASNPREFTATTAARGKARFEVPHLNFKFKEATFKGYLTREELAPYRGYVQQQYLDKREKHADDELHFDVWLVPTKWLDENVKIRTRQAALAIANDWARECAKDGPSKEVELFNNAVWIATYPCMEVRVSMRDGAVSVKTPDVVSRKPLYPPDEALKDALSSPLEYVGAAVWPDRYKIPSCVYRNDKVLVVNSYCIRKEQHSISIAVLHPERGSAGFYAEGRNDDRITQLTRDDYTQWKFGASDPFPGLTLTMSMDELLKYEGRRGKFAKGGCVAGMVLGNDRNASCGLKSPEVEQWWEGYYRPILKQPPPEWFTLVKELQGRVKKDGKKDPRYE